MKTKNIVFKWFFEYFKLFCFSDFSFLYNLQKCIEKIYENKILHLTCFLVISRYFLAQIFHSYIFTKTFWKICENKLLYSSYVLVISRYFLAQIFHSNIFAKIFWKLYENNCIWNNLKQFKWYFKTYFLIFFCIYIIYNIYRLLTISFFYIFCL